MDKERQFSLQNSKDAHKNGQLFDWIQGYLRNEGANAKLADYLLEAKPQIIILQKFPLNKLIRIMGPEEGMQFTESQEKWDKRIEDLVDRIKEGAEFPPLIVTDLWKALQLSDGSHRHEALLRSGVSEYWTAFLFTKEESKRLLEIEYDLR